MRLAFLVTLQRPYRLLLLIRPAETAQIQRPDKENHTSHNHFEQILRPQTERPHTNCPLQHVKQSSARKPLYEPEVLEHTTESELCRYDEH